ncbi:MAG: hypothetical protein KGL39_18460 [Patescibacteria group bacterium]|nr:hypothetical protein [Patescibacteria group bacterium]
MKGEIDMPARMLLICIVAFVVATTPPPRAAHYVHRSGVVLPDPAATPGEVDPDLTAAKLCSAKFHTGSVRDVTESQKKRICEAYGQKDCPGRGYEIDHLVSIELGGANTDANLWPQPVDAAGVIGFHTKDVVENRLHALVCKGKLDLAEAQNCIADDWYECAQQWNILPEKEK